MKRICNTRSIRYSAPGTQYQRISTDEILQNYDVIDSIATTKPTTCPDSSEWNSSATHVETATWIS